MVGLVMVLYTAVVTPFDVSYLQPKLDALFVFNRIVDVYFLADMILQFFLMPQDENGRYIKSQRAVRAIIEHSCLLALGFQPSDQES